MKYMILSNASQLDYDGMSGKASGQPAWTTEEVMAMVRHMEKVNNDLQESGELVETRGLDAPVHTRRFGPGDVVTDGPYAETQEVLAGYWVVEVDGLERATEIAAMIGACPAPEHVLKTAYVDIRPITEAQPFVEM